MFRPLITFIALLVCAPTWAATLWVSEFLGAPPVSVYYQAVKTPVLASQALAVGGSSTQSAAFNISTGIIRVQADVACHVVIGGTSPTATTASMPLIAGQTEYFIVTAGDKLAVIVSP